eukprot:augustus_masked-scaffold_32-processed-gene-1.2-mRNA-1 protein AED:0.09 eAED:0.09 QI:0/-1/0/1/-1/1/1/0/230
MSKTPAPKAVTDWIATVVDEVFTEKQVKITDPKNLDVQSICPTFPNYFPVFIEISKGSHNKYEWDVEHNIMILDRVLSSAVFYPYDYGFIPQTLCEDGDPLDVLVIASDSVMSGVVCRARPLGYLAFEDVEKSIVNGKEVETYVGDEKVIAVLEGDAFFDNWQSLEDVPERTLLMIEEFFKNYKNLEKKTKLKPRTDKGWKGLEETRKLISDVHVTFTKKVEDGLARRSN